MIFCARFRGLRQRLQRFLVRHVGLVPASNPPRAPALEARWTPERVRGDGNSVIDVGFDVRTSLTEGRSRANRSEEHTSELQSLMRISYAVFCMKNKNTT